MNFQVSSIYCEEEKDVEDMISRLKEFISSWKDKTHTTNRLQTTEGVRVPNNRQTGSAIRI